MIYEHINIANRPFEETLSIMRRWVHRNVGFENGRLKDCVICYDYIKLMTGDGLSGHMQEYQALGFVTTALTNFALQNDLPILAFGQLNREGITKEDTDIVAGSDRLGWFAANVSIFKKKSDEEIVEDGPNGGSHKLIPLIARHGPGLENKEYITMTMDKKSCKIVEGKTNFELKSNKVQQQGEFKANVNDDIPFTDDPT